MITFTRETPTVSDSGKVSAPTITDIQGSGVLVSADAGEYVGLGLDIGMAPTILFTPTGYPQRAFTDDTVKVGDRCVLNGMVFTVRRVLVTAPDLFVVCARVIVSR